MRSGAGHRGVLLPLVSLLLAACTGGSAGSAASVSSSPGSGSPGATQNGPQGTPGPVAFVNVSDGGSVPATHDADGHVVVEIQVRVSGMVALTVDLSVDGSSATDVGGRELGATNTAGTDPFSATFQWSPLYGGGEYALTANALDEQKQITSATVHITVTGVARATLPPPMTRAEALARWNSTLAASGVSIPSPSMQRFDFTINPTRSRWIVAAYYKGTRYYGQFFDDGHTEWSNAAYSDPTTRPDNVGVAWCRPAGSYKILVVFVDYGNTGTVKADALAKVPVVTTWLNRLYASFATGQGQSSPVMSVASEAVYLSSPPTPGQLLTSQQIRAATGKSSSAFDFIIQIDLDNNGTVAANNYPGLVEPGGGLALHDCETEMKSGPINIWSSLTAGSDVQGALVMDLNHEFSHMFGMMDDWPFTQGITGPGDSPVDDWIPYVMFGWTDTDGDGIPEIVDSTPYGTTGPKP